MIINDGTGTGQRAKVDHRNRLSTVAVTESYDREINRLDGKVWSVTSNTTPVGANDFIFYFKNTGDESITVTDIRASAAGASKLYIQAVSGTPSFAAGADLTPVNRNLGKVETITATIKEDTNTTGLSDDGTIFILPCPTANTLYHISTSSGIIIPKGQAIAAYTSGTTAMEVVWSFVGTES